MPQRGSPGRLLLFSLAVVVTALTAGLILDSFALFSVPAPQRTWLTFALAGATAAAILAFGSSLALRRREAEAVQVQFRNFLESLPEAVVVASPHGAIVFVNGHMERLLGHGRACFIGKPLDTFLRPAAKMAEEVSGDAGLSRSRQSSDRQFIARCKDGRELLVEVSCNTMRVRGETLLITILRDTTARWKSDCRRAARRGTSRALAESVTLDEAAPRLLRTVCESFGWDLGVLWSAASPAGQLGRVAAWLRPGVDDTAFAPLQNGGASAPPLSLLDRTWRNGEADWHLAPAKPGSRTQLGAFTFPVHLGPQPVGVLAFYARAAEEPDEALQATMLAVGTQVAQFVRRARAEEAVRASEARQAAILEAALDAVITLDAAGRVVDFNPAAEALFGYPAARIRGRRIAELLVPPCARGEFRTDLAEAAVGAAPVRRECTLRAANGLEIPIEIGLAPIRCRDAPLVTAYVRDLTEQKKTEERLRHTEEQFRQAQKMEAVGQLAGGVAHDFNNLLTVIGGHTDLLLNDAEISADARDSLEQVRDAGRRAAALTRQLLAFSRKQVLVPQVLNLPTIVADMARMLRRLIGEHIELELALAPDLWPVRADHSQIEQALLNLAVNARDAMPCGGTLTIGAANCEPNGHRVGPAAPAGRLVALSVRDTGIGIDPSVRERIFEPFFTTKPRGQGSGLGLAMVYGIVKQSGGLVTVDSAPGAGTTMTLFLPATELPALARPAPPLAPSERSLPRTVLLVEDDDMVRAVTRGMLAVKGCRVLEARDGKDALRLWDGIGPAVQLLVTDVVMPGMNGCKLAEQLRRLRPDLKVLFVSGETNGLFLDPDGLPQGSAFLAKPFAPDTLDAAVQSLLASAGT